MSYKSKMAYTPKHNVTNFLLYLFFIILSNWTEATDFLSGENVFCILLIYVQGTILDPTKARKIITFWLIMSVVFP